MKKIFIALMLAMFSMATFNYAVGLPQQTTQHLKKDGTPDKRYKENKTPKVPVTKSGKPDMRYKANNPNAGKKKKS